MFKKFNHIEDITGQNQAKSSVSRGIRSKILQDYPNLDKHIDDILPKKEPLCILKCRDHIELITIKSDILFYKQRDGPYVPTLRLVHKYPFMLPQVQVDRGAIRFILSGANIMCPGLTSSGARMETPFEPDVIVSVMAESKEHSLCIGLTKMSSQDILQINKGVAIESLHYLCDGLWEMKEARR